MDFDNKAFPLYTNSVFGGWDYCINSEKMAVYKQRMIYNEFKVQKLETYFIRPGCSLFILDILFSLCMHGNLRGHPFMMATKKWFTCVRHNLISKMF